MTSFNKLTLSVGKKNDKIATPAALYTALDSLYRFDFDPCPLNPTFDGLAIPWGERNYVNPPYSEIKKWVQKALEEKDQGKMSLFLITLRTQSKYWAELIFPNCTDLRFISAFCFEGYDHVFTIPVCLVEFDPSKPPIFQRDDVGKYTSFRYDGIRHTQVP